MIWIKWQLRYECRRLEFLAVFLRGGGRGGFQPLKKKNASLVSSFSNKMLFDANTEVRKICLACLVKMRDQRQEVI